RAVDDQRPAVVERAVERVRVGLMQGIVADDAEAAVIVDRAGAEDLAARLAPRHGAVVDQDRVVPQSARRAGGDVERRALLHDEPARAGQGAPRPVESTRDPERPDQVDGAANKAEFRRRRDGAVDDPAARGAVLDHETPGAAEDSPEVDDLPAPGEVNR